MDTASFLPIFLVSLMGLAVFLYVILDGFDLGIGTLLPLATPEEREVMIEAIGPFWDANESWLILALGLLVAAFPIAYATLIPALYPPIFVMIAGLLMRAAAFAMWSGQPRRRGRFVETLFVLGSLLAALGQGYVLGKFTLVFRSGLANDLFSGVIALCLTAGYVALGAAWLMHKAHGALQRKAALWLRRALAPGALGMAFVSLAMPLASDRVYDKWLAWPYVGMLAPIPIVCACLFGWLFFLTHRLPARGDRHALKPFLFLAGLFALGFAGIVYSANPFLVPEKLTIARAAAPAARLPVIAAVAVLATLAIAACTALAYRQYRGKAVRADGA